MSECSDCAGLSAGYIRRLFLQNIPLEDLRGQPYPEANLEDALRATMAEWTRLYGVLWQPTRVVVGEVPPDKLPPEPEPLRRRPGIDYEASAFFGDKWGLLKLPYYPINQMLYLAISLGGNTQPAILEFGSQWWRLNENRLSMRVYPGWNNLAITSLALYQLALLGGNSRVIPQSWRAAYLAGYDNVREEAPDLARALAAAATIKVLPTLASLRDREGSVSSQSVSVDGLSQSRAYPVTAQSHRYSPLQNNLQTELDGFLRRYFDTKPGRPRVVVP